MITNEHTETISKLKKKKYTMVAKLDTTDCLQ